MLIGLEFQVPEVAPSLNRLMRMHWAARRKLLKKWEVIVWAELYRIGAHEFRYKGKVRVDILRRSSHLVDADNLHGAAKVILDALKTSKVIADDSPEHIELHCEQESGRTSTVVRLTPIISLTESSGSPDEPHVSR